MYHDGLVGSSITTPAVITTDSNDDLGLTSNNISISFLAKFTGYSDAPTGQLDFLQDIQGNWTISIDTTGHILFFVNGSSGNTISTTTATVSLDTWYVIDCVFFEGDHYVYINGVPEFFDYNDGNYDGDATNNGIQIKTYTPVTNICFISQVIGYDTAISQALITSKYNNYTDAGFWAISTYENVDDSALVSEGKATLYYKSLTSGDWVLYLENDSPVRLENYPVNAFVERNGSYFIVATNQGTIPTYYVVEISSGAIDENYLSLGTFPQSSFAKSLIQQSFSQTVSIDYFNNQSNVAEYSTPDSSVFVAGGAIQSLVEWKKYLAMGYNSRRRGYMSLWDLVNTQDSELVDLGTGNVRIIGNTADTLFAVIDNFSDSAISSSNRPTMEIRQYTGNGETTTTHILDIFK